MCNFLATIMHLICCGGAQYPFARHAGMQTCRYARAVDTASWQSVTTATPTPTTITTTTTTSTTTTNTITTTAAGAMPQGAEDPDYRGTSRVTWK